MSRALHPCPSCHVELIPSGVYLCDACEASAQKKSRARNPRGKSPYDKKWERVRSDHLIMQPRCVDCSVMASEVDHIVPIEQGGAKYDHANLASHCKSCHSRKTATMDGGFGNQVIPISDR